MQGQKLPLETIQALRAAREAGSTIGALMIQYGFTGRTINRHTFGLGPRAKKELNSRLSGRIINLLLEFGSLSVREMVEKTGQNRSYIHKTLTDLREEGAITSSKLRDNDFDKRTRDFYRLTREELELSVTRAPRENAREGDSNV